MSGALVAMRRRCCCGGGFVSPCPTMPDQMNVQVSMDLDPLKIPDMDTTIRRQESGNPRYWVYEHPLPEAYDARAHNAMLSIMQQVVNSVPWTLYNVKVLDTQTWQNVNSCLFYRRFALPSYLNCSGYLYQLENPIMAQLPYTTNMGISSNIFGSDKYSGSQDMVDPDNVYSLCQRKRYVDASYWYLMHYVSLRASREEYPLLNPTQFRWRLDFAWSFWTFRASSQTSDCSPKWEPCIAPFVTDSNHNAPAISTHPSNKANGGFWHCDTSPSVWPAMEAIEDCDGSQCFHADVTPYETTPTGSAARCETPWQNAGDFHRHYDLGTGSHTLGIVYPDSSEVGTVTFTI